MKKIPNLFIIGAPKCGTTSIVLYLSKHPDIFVCPVKEPHYFNEDSQHRYYYNETEYLNLFQNVSNEAYRAEGSVWYLYSKVAVDNILKFNPDAKFIVMLRNPVDMFFSLHQEMLFGGSENVMSPKLAWELQEERLKGNKIPNGAYDPSFIQYGEACKLGAQSQRALQKISSENLHFITLDALKNNPDLTYNETLSFLGLHPTSLETYEVVNPKKVRKSYVLSQLLIGITNVKRKLGIKGGLGLANKINAANVSHNVAIDSEEKETLIPILNDYFKNDIELLETITGFDLSHWKSSKL